MLQTIRLALRLIELKRVARKPPEAVARLQAQRLRRLVRLAVGRSPFYRAKYRGIDPDRFELAQLPPTSKRELMAHFDNVVTDPAVRREDVERFIDNPANLGRYLRGKYAVSHTSGSQGQPLLIVQDRLSLELLFGLQFTRGNVFTKIGPLGGLRRLLEPGRLAVVTMKPGFYPSASAFAYLPAALRPFVRVLRLSWTDADLVEKLNAFRPHALTDYACVLETLAVRADQLRLAPELRQVVNNSEQLTPRARDHIGKAFGVPVLDNYATGECPFLSNGCPAEPGAHVNADWAILEVVDEEYRPVPPGQLGKKVLVTNLANAVQPFLRYEVDDVVAMADDESCPCGSRLPRVARVEGRAAEEFWVGETGAYRPVLGGIFKSACDYLHDIREWQAVQEERNRVCVRLEPLPGVKLDRERARRVLADKLKLFGLPAGVAVEVDVVPSLTPEPIPGKKFRRLVSRVGPPDGARRAEGAREVQPVGV